MSAIYIILIYVIICFCMILFNTFIILYGKVNTKINTLKTRKMKEKIKSQLNRLKNNFMVEEEHLKYLKRNLKKGNKLMIFDSIVTSYQKRENPCINKYLDSLKDLFAELMYYYVKKNVTERAYFLSVIKDYNVLYQNNKLEIDSILNKLLQDNNFYCRDNAYLAICKMGMADKMVRALLNISQSSKFFYIALLMNGLNMYNGEQVELLKLLMKEFNAFRDDIKCCIIEYASYYSNDYNDFILGLILSKDTSKELKISCLHYFEYVFYDKAEDVIVECVNTYLDDEFSLCYASVKALRNYNSKKSIETIMKAIYSDNFKIRDIACESLAVIRLGFNANDANDFPTEDNIDDMYYYHVRKNMEKMVK